ncbi:MAG: S24/S26 family peptidase [Rikenellaceae bacterium]
MKLLDNDKMLSEVVSLIDDGHSVTITVRGISMRPLLRDLKDKVILEAYNKEELRPMDVVLFRYNDKYLLHRIIKREGDDLLIKGDGNLFSSETAKVSDVKAIVKCVIRGSSKQVKCSSLGYKIVSGVWVMMPRIMKRVYFKLWK